MIPINARDEKTSRKSSRSIILVQNASRYAEVARSEWRDGLQVFAKGGIRTSGEALITEGVGS